MLDCLFKEWRHPRRWRAALPAAVSASCAGSMSEEQEWRPRVQDVRDADVLILGAPGRQGGMCGEMRMFLDSLAPLQVERKGNSCGVLKVTRSPAISLSLTLQLHSLAPLQVERKGNSCGVLKVTWSPAISLSLTMQLHSLHSRASKTLQSTTATESSSMIMH